MKVKALYKRFISAGLRQKITVVSAAFIIYVLLLTGIFSYFHSEDEVTNRMNGQNGSVTIQEPAWDREDQYQAQASEPGMAIKKDPYAVNDGQIDEFIRIKMTVSLKGFKDRTEADGTVNTYYRDSYNDNTGEAVTALTEEEQTARRKRRLISILSALRLGTGDSAQALFTWDDMKKDISERQIAGCVNSGYEMDLDGITIGDTSAVIYFYYTGGLTDDGGAPVMKAVKPEGNTDRLFDLVEIPVYKAEYLGVFDQEYDITLAAEAIPAGNFPEGLTFSRAKEEF